MKILCKNKHWKIAEEYNINKILYLLIGRPTYINHWNDFVWKNKKCQLHRDYDLPAFIHKNGHVSWHENNKLNRENDKPAIIRCNGEKEYYIKNKFIKI